MEIRPIATSCAFFLLIRGSRVTKLGASSAVDLARCDWTQPSVVIAAVVGLHIGLFIHLLQGTDEIVA